MCDTMTICTYFLLDNVGTCFLRFNALPLVVRLNVNIINFLELDVFLIFHYF